MSKKGYNYAFKLYMEGVNIPFRSATIACNPNGVEMNINVFPNKEILNLKAKTAVQVFYREWHSKKKDAPWLIMGEGFFSSFYTLDEATEGRGIGLVCRDFRMDIRRAPAALAWEKAQDLTTQTFYNSMGIFQTFVIKGITKGRGTKTRIFDSTGLAPLSYALSIIAGSAGYGGKKQKTGQSSKSTNKTNTSGSTVFANKEIPESLSHIGYALSMLQKNEQNNNDFSPQKNGETAYEKEFSGCTPTNNGVAGCGFYLDAIIRGMWTEAIGGTSVGVFINKRIRMDKHFLVPVNKSGYNFWNRQKASVHIGSYLMGNSRFSSLEAAIMRLAGAFSARVYSCSTPSLIPLGDDAAGNPLPSVKHVIDENVRKFLIERASAEFGAKFTLNSSMLLPPLEFTAPPNCNLLFPPMYNRVEWRYDIDVDVTRGYFSQTHMLSSHGSNALSSPSIQVPNALFNIQKDKKATDLYGRRKPPLTLEERYKGVNVAFGSVSYELAANDARKVIKEHQLLKKRKNALQDQIDDLHNEKETRDNKLSGAQGFQAANKAAWDETEETLNIRLNKKRDEMRKLRLPTSLENRTSNALKHHALLKFLNQKFQGRVLTVDGAFNPYIMCGFPGAVIADDLGRGKESMKTVIGMVQQVKHMIYITPNGAEANTSIVMNNVRFEDEPTDIDKFGSPLYMQGTVPKDAEIDPKTLEYVNTYFVPEPEAPVERILNSHYYDLNDKTKLFPGHKYAKDLLSLTANDVKNGERNQIYIDEAYEPTRIAKFYRDVFGHTADHFMIGSAPDNRAKPNKNGRIYFMYDTIHEALVKVRENNPELLTDYDAALEFVRRNICSADAYFQGIMGASVKTTNDGKEVYTTTLDNFKDHKIHDRYYGVTTNNWESNPGVSGLKSSKGGEMYGPGEFSTIREHTPFTPFIKERRDIVEQYLLKAQREVVGLTYQEKY